MRKEQYRNVTFRYDENSLLIALTEEGVKYLQGCRFETRSGLSWNNYPDIILAELMEDVFCNSGWDWLTANEIGALTSCTMLLTSDYERDDSGTLISHGIIYQYERHQIELEIDVLFKTGKLEMKGTK